MKLYELHKVVNEATGEHQPLRIGVGNPPPVAMATQKSVDEVWAMAQGSDARPVVKHPDGRVQVGHYVYVPVKGESA